MAKAKYKFTRSNSLSGFARTNRASTDALNALSEWQNKDKNWSYEVEVDEDEKLIAVLTFGDSDSEKAGVTLEIACDRYGIVREYLSA